MVVIIVKDGVVREVLSETPGEALVIDMDRRVLDEAGPGPLPLPEGERVIASLERRPITANPLFIGALRDRISQALP